MFDPITMLAAIAPVVVEAGKAAVQRWIAPDQVKALTVEDALKLKEHDLKFFTTLTQADQGGDTYPWVEAIRKLQRPMVVVAVLFTWSYLHLTGTGTETTMVDNMTSAVGFYLFGDRTMFYTAKKAGK